MLRTAHKKVKLPLLKEIGRRKFGREVQTSIKVMERSGMEAQQEVRELESRYFTIPTSVLKAPDSKPRLARDRMSYSSWWRSTTHWPTSWPQKHTKRPTVSLEPWSAPMEKIILEFSMIRFLRIFRPGIKSSRGREWSTTSVIPYIFCL